MEAGRPGRDPGGRDTWLGDAWTEAVVALVVLVPVTYLLLLILRVILVVGGLAHYASAKSFLLTGFSEVLAGSALMAMFSLKGTLKGVAKDGPHSVDVRGHVRTGVWVRAPFALLFAGLTDLPDGRAAHVVIGSYWGAVVTAFAMSHTVLILKKPVAMAWVGVVLAETLVVLGFIGGVVAGLRNHASLVTAVEIGAAAAASCAFTYFFALAGSRLARCRS